MNNKIIIINGPNLNLLGEREQSQYGSITLDKLKENCQKKSKDLGLLIEFAQSNVEGELVNLIQDSRKNFDGMIINAAAFTHTSVAIRDALSIFKKPIIEIHMSNIYKREEFRHKSLISDIVTGGIFGLGDEGATQLLRYSPIRSKKSSTECCTSFISSILIAPSCIPTFFNSR